MVDVFCLLTIAKIRLKSNVIEKVVFRMVETVKFYSGITVSVIFFYSFGV